MTGRVWCHRPIGRLDYELEVDGQVGVLVSMQRVVDRPSALIRKLVRVTAEHHRDQFVLDGRRAGGIDWEALGWSDQSEHDGLLAALRAKVDGWSGHPLEAGARAHLAAQKLDHGLPPHGPYSIDQLDLLDRIVQRAPVLAAQEAQAEGAPA